MLQAINGDGIDRHLLGLKLIAIEQGENVPELFMDSAYTQSTHFNLSTSQVGKLYVGNDSIYYTNHSKW